MGGRTTGGLPERASGLCGNWCSPLANLCLQLQKIKSGSHLFPRHPTPHPSFPVQQSLARFSQLIPQGPWLISSLLAPMNSLRSKQQVSQSFVCSAFSRTPSTLSLKGGWREVKHTLLLKNFKTARHDRSMSRGPSMTSLGLRVLWSKGLPPANAI